MMTLPRSDVNTITRGTTKRLHSGLYMSAKNPSLMSKRKFLRVNGGSSLTSFLGSAMLDMDDSYADIFVFLSTRVDTDADMHDVSWVQNVNADWAVVD